MARGFVYLVAIVDWFTRRVLAWRVSMSMDVAFCIEALEEALALWQLGSFNIDQGSQLTVRPYPPSCSEEIAISMDGKGFWRLVEYKEVYLNACALIHEARASIGGCLAFYKRVGHIQTLVLDHRAMYNSASYFSQRHDQPAAVYLLKPRACSDKRATSYIRGPRLCEVAHCSSDLGG